MESKKVILAGNPNVGKSTVFNQLTGLKHHTGNWTGKTVDAAVGNYIYNGTDYNVLDLPGAYSFAAGGEEKIATDAIKSNDIDLIVIIADATNLERNLNLTLQILKMTKNVLLCINLMDEAKRQNICVDLEKLKKILNIEVIGISAIKKRDITHLKTYISQAAVNNAEIEPIDITTETVEDCFKQAFLITDQVVTQDGACAKYTVDRIVTSKRYGFPIMIGFFALIFWLTIEGANYPSELLSAMFAWLHPYVLSALEFIRLPAVVVSVLMDGVYTVTTWVVSVMLPPMAIFFPLFTLLEDLGFLPRIAFNLDKFFKRAAACGKQSLTM